jgi:hypothetical protein
VSDVITAEAIHKLQSEYFMQFILDNSKVLDELHHKLKGETLIEEEREINGQKVLVPVWRNIWDLKPIMNNIGINFVMTKLNMAMCTTNATGNISELQCSMLTQEAYQQIIANFRLKWELFGFASESEMESLASDLRIIIFTHLSKSKEMGFMKQVGTSYSYAEIRDNKNKKEAQEPNMTI